MKHYEMHTVDTHADADAAVASGLLQEHFYVTECVACGDDVGALDAFEPYVIVLDDEEQWELCAYCAEVVTDPSRATSTYDAYLIDEDGFIEVDDA